MPQPIFQKGNSFLRQVILVGLLIISLVILVKFAFPLFDRVSFWTGDYETYWVTGKIFLNGENPYLLENIRETRLAYGLPYSPTDGVSRYPPWSLLFMALFGIFDLSTSRLVWLLILLTIIFMSAEYFWKEYTGFSNHRWLGQILTFTFAPTIFVLGRVQLTPLLLLGITAFALFIKKKDKTWLAGASLLLLTIKPHIPYLLLLAIGLWIVKERKWAVGLGALAAISIFLLGAEIVNPQIIWQYISARQENYSQLDWATPTLGILLRSIFGYDLVWLGLVSPAIGVAILFFYWLRMNKQWEWNEQIPLLLLVSILTTIFMWTYDAVVLIPTILFAAAHILRQRSPKSQVIFIFLYVLLNFATVLLHRKFDEAFFFWFAPLLLALYVTAMWPETILWMKKE